MSFLKEKKAQTGTETLLMIAAAIVIAIVVGLYLKNMATQIQPNINTQEENILNNF